MTAGGGGEIGCRSRRGCSRCCSGWWSSASSASGWPWPTGGSYAPEVAYGADEVLTADASIVLDSTLALDGPAVEPCPAVSMPIPAEYSATVKGSQCRRQPPHSAGQTSVRLSSTSWLLIVCLGDADKTGTPEQIVQRHRTDADFSGSFPVQLRPVHVTAPFGEAVRWSGSFAPDGTGKCARGRLPAPGDRPGSDRTGRVDARRSHRRSYRGAHRGSPGTQPAGGSQPLVVDTT